MPTTETKTIERPGGRAALAALLLALLLLAGALAQEDPVTENEDPAHAPDFVLEGLEPTPGEPGAVAFRVEGADGQTPNVTLVGPGGVVAYDEAREGVFEGLEPGAYAVAATEDGHRLAVGTLELGAEERAGVLLTLFSLSSFWEDEADATFLGFTIDVADNVDDDGEAELVVAAAAAVDGTIVVTGPDGLQRTSGTAGEFALEDLDPGRYHVAVTAPEREMAQSTVELGASQRVRLEARPEAGGER